MTIAVVVIIFAFSLITLITSVEKVFFPSSTAIGSGNLRFMLTYSPPDSDNAFSELLVEVKPGGDPQAILSETQRIIDEEMHGVNCSRRVQAWLQ